MTNGSAGIPMDYSIFMPAQLPSDAGAKGFRDGFFSGEPGAICKPAFETAGNIGFRR